MKNKIGRRSLLKVIGGAVAALFGAKLKPTESTNFCWAGGSFGGQQPKLTPEQRELLLSELRKKYKGKDDGGLLAAPVFFDPDKIHRFDERS